MITSAAIFSKRKNMSGATILAITVYRFFKKIIQTFLAYVMLAGVSVSPGFISYWLMSGVSTDQGRRLVYSIGITLLTWIVLLSSASLLFKIGKASLNYFKQVYEDVEAEQSK